MENERPYGGMGGGGVYSFNSADAGGGSGELQEA